MFGLAWTFGLFLLSWIPPLFNFFGFNVPSEISWNWQYTDDKFDETKVSYKNAIKTFKETYETYEK